MQSRAIIGSKNAEGGPAQSQRLVEHRLEYRRQVAARLIDDLQHVRRRGLLLHGLIQLGSTLAELLPEFGNGPPKTGDRVVRHDAHSHTP